MYYCQFERNKVVVRSETGRLIRQFTGLRWNVVGAQVSGDYVTIQYDNGKTEVYNTEGRFIRRT